MPMIIMTKRESGVKGACNMTRYLTRRIRISEARMPRRLVM